MEGVDADVIARVAIGPLAIPLIAGPGAITTTIKPATIAIIARLGGLLLATLGAQMLLGGLRDSFA